MDNGLGRRDPRTRKGNGMTESDTRRQLDIGVAGAAIVFPFKNIPALVQIGLAPGLIAAAICLLIYRFMWPSGIEANTPEEMRRLQEAFYPGDLLIQITLYVLGIVFAVAVHRYIVRGEHPGWLIFRFGRNELAYAATLLIFGAIYMIIPTLLLSIAWILGFVPAAIFDAQILQDPDSAQRLLREFASPAFLTFVFILWIFLIWLQFRLALMFPHAAVTGRISLSVSWNAMRGNFWRFVGAAILVLLGIMIIYFAAMFAGLLALGFLGLLNNLELQVPGEATQAANNIYVIFFLGAGFVSLLAVLATIGIAFISYIYRDLVEEPAETSAAS